LIARGSVLILMEIVKINFIGIEASWSALLIDHIISKNPLMVKLEGLTLLARGTTIEDVPQRGRRLPVSNQTS